MLNSKHLGAPARLLSLSGAICFYFTTACSSAEPIENTDFQDALGPEELIEKGGQTPSIGNEYLMVPVHAADSNPNNEPKVCYNTSTDSLILLSANAANGAQCRFTLTGSNTNQARFEFSGDRFMRAKGSAGANAIVNTGSSFRTFRIRQNGSWDGGPAYYIEPRNSGANGSVTLDVEDFGESSQTDIRVEDKDGDNNQRFIFRNPGT